MECKLLEVRNDLEKEISFSIRKKVFIEEQSVTEAEEFDEWETSSRHFLFFLESTPIGTVRFRITSKGIKLERIAILREYRGKGYGLQLVQQILSIAKSLHPSQIYLHAQVSVIPFYEKLLFTPVGEIFYDARIPHKEMILKTIFES